MKHQGTKQSRVCRNGTALASVLLSALTVLLSLSSVRAATVGPAFTYQGNLSEGGAPANGLYDFRFSLHASPASAGIIGTLITNSPVVVTQGHFTVLLDFGPDTFTGEERWLQIGVRTNGSDSNFTPLDPRQAISATPYATFAVNANVVVGPIDASSIQSGTLNVQRMNTNVALLNTPQKFTEVNTFNAGVIINPTGEKAPLKIVGGNQVPHLSVSPDTNTTTGAVLGLDTSDHPGGNEYFIKVAGDNEGEDAGKLIVRNETTGRNLLTFSTNHFVGINEDSPTNRLHVGGKVSAGGFVGSGSDLTGLNADAITSGTINSGRLNTNVAVLNRNNQIFTGNNRFEGMVTTGTSSSDNIVLGVSGNLNRGAISLKDENNTTEVHLRVTANGGEIEARNVAGDSRALMYVDDKGTGVINLRGTNGNSNVLLTHTSNPDHGFVGVYGSSGDPKAAMYVTDDGKGWMETDVLRVKGGADIAEPFLVRPADLGLGHKIEPGMLVAIDPDPERAGELRLSTLPYDRTVAGIISGAGGVNTGMVLQQKGTLADGDHPVALTGRVWCYVDAGAGAVIPGDLLTTSEVPGHAMKVTDHTRAQGAIVGKAMTKLEQGRGLVLVLVSLQ